MTGRILERMECVKKVGVTPLRSAIHPTHYHPRISGLVIALLLGLNFKTELLIERDSAAVARVSCEPAGFDL